MEYYAAIDVSLELSSACVVDSSGKIVREAKVASEPEALVAFFRDLDRYPARQGGIESDDREDRSERRARDGAADADGLVPAGHVKTLPAQEIRALLTGRKMLQNKLQDVELCIRGLLRGFGLKVGKVSAGRYEARIRELVLGHPMLQPLAAAMLQARTGLRAEFNKLHRMLLQIVRGDADCRRFMTAPGVGAVVAVTYKTAIDFPLSPISS